MPKSKPSDGEGRRQPRHHAMLSLLGLLASTSAQPRPQKDQELRQSTEQADPVVTFGPSEPSAALIWMHGLGDTPDGWAQLLRDEVATELPHLRFVLPQAPVRPVTANGGQPMTSWMDLEALPVTMALKDPVSSTPHAPHRNNSSHTAY